MTETTNLFSPATSWLEPTSEGATYLGYCVYIRRCHNSYLYFNIVNTYIFINLSFKLFIYLIYLSYKFIYYFLPFVIRRPPSAVRRPPSAVPSLTESCFFVGNGTQSQLNIVYVDVESLRF